MRTFRVKVNDKQYEVEVEEIVHFPTAAPATETQKKKTPPPKPVASPMPTAEPGDGNISAPMPGTIHNVSCQVGQTVKCGDILLILEAMKMENEIQSPMDGTVKEIKVAKGQSVESGDVLVIIE